MSYDESKELCRENWEEESNYLHINRSKKEIKEDMVVVMKAKTHLQKVFLKRNIFRTQKTLFTNKSREDLENSEEPASRKNQVEDLRLQDKIGNQNFHQNVKKLYEPPINTNKDASKNLTKTNTVTYINNKEALQNINQNVLELLELLKDKVIMAPYLAFPLVNVFKAENKTQFELISDQNSIEMNDFLINQSLPVALYSNLLTFRDTNRIFKLDGHLLKRMTNYNFNVGNSIPKDNKLINEFAKELKTDIKQKRRPINRDKFLTKLTKSPAVTPYGISTIFSTSDSNELCDKLKLLLQKKQAGNISKIIDEKSIAIADK